jgi:hypothetical protein
MPESEVQMDAQRFLAQPIAGLAFSAKTKSPVHGQLLKRRKFHDVTSQHMPTTEHFIISISH